MWIVRTTFWKNGRRLVKAQKSFETKEQAEDFRQSLGEYSEIFETNLPHDKFNI